MEKLSFSDWKKSINIVAENDAIKQLLSMDTVEANNLIDAAVYKEYELYLTIMDE